jgi:hypothetical protein
VKYQGENPCEEWIDHLEEWKTGLVSGEYWWEGKRG